VRVYIVHRASKAVLDANGDPRYYCSTCGKPIKPGDSYRWAKGRYTSRRIKCADHDFRPSELTGSDKIARVREIAEAMCDFVVEEGMTEEDVEGQIDDWVAGIDEVIDEYNQAADYFGGQGTHADRADALESWKDEIQAIDLPEYPVFDVMKNPSYSDVDTYRGDLEAWRLEVVEAIREAANCPL
jgi:hypothetical protein